MLDDAVSLVIDALGGRAAAAVLEARFAPRLLARGSFSDVPRFAAFREEPVVLGDVQARGEWAARAVVTKPRRPRLGDLLPNWPATAGRRRRRNRPGR
jgi:hypothetical protein